MSKKSAKANIPKSARGKNAYMFYLDSNRANIKAEILAAASALDASDDDTAKLTPSGSVKLAEVTKIAGANWKALSPEEKAPFEVMASLDSASKLKALKD